MNHEEDLQMKPPSLWRSRIIFAIVVAFCFIGLLLATGALWRTFFNRPPISITSLDPAHLGDFCPTDEVPIHNYVNINDSIIVFYYISTLDEEANMNYAGTQRAYVDMLHPHPASFEQVFSWKVPELPPGSYSRVFGVRNVGAIQDVVFLVATYNIKRGCPKEVSSEYGN